MDDPHSLSFANHEMIHLSGDIILYNLQIMNDLLVYFEILMVYHEWVPIEGPH